MRSRQQIWKADLHGRSARDLGKGTAITIAVLVAIPSILVPIVATDGLSAPPPRSDGRLHLDLPGMSIVGNRRRRDLPGARPFTTIRGHIPSNYGVVATP